MLSTRFLARSVKSRLGYAATFFAGAAIAALANSWMRDDGVVELAMVDSKSVAPAAEVVETSAFQADSDNPALAQVDPSFPNDFACQPRPNESARDEFRRLLRELVQAQPGEHESRIGLLLARLRKRGGESVPVILEYLRSGRNLSADGVFGEGALFGGGSHYRDLRTLLYLSLAQIAAEHSELRREIASAGIEQARNLADVLSVAEAAAADEGTRKQVIAAVTRLTDDTSIYGNYYQVIDAAVRLKSPEILSALYAANEARPYNFYVDSYLGALWSFPEATRRELAQKFVDSPSVREVMRGRPESWRWLDANVPAFRRAIVEDFHAVGREEAQVALLRSVSLESKEMSERVERDSIIPRDIPSFPDAKGQARARLVLLADLARYCDTPLLQAENRDAQARLRAVLAKP